MVLNIRGLGGSESHAFLVLADSQEHWNAGVGCLGAGAGYYVGSSPGVCPTCHGVELRTGSHSLVASLAWPHPVLWTVVLQSDSPCTLKVDTSGQGSPRQGDA